MIASAHPWLGTEALARALAEGELEIEGRLPGASNVTLRCTVPVADDVEVRCVYKPVRGERPLWDFPDGTLTGRELAAYRMSIALGWPVIPPTAWRDDGPAGPGMCQAWIDASADRSVVDVVDASEPTPGWLRVFEGTDASGRPVVLVHEDSASLQRVALLDAVINNADRKGGHLLTDAQGGLWGIDHGVTFSDEDKLRTVLWGWAGKPIPDPLLQALADVQRHEGHADACSWLGEDEVAALDHRIRTLLRERVFPLPAGQWPSIPWPVF